MKRDKFIIKPELTALLLSSGICMAADQNASNRPNIILCMADDQGWGDMGYYGHPLLKTPNLDEMEKVSLRFDRFYAAAPVCSPTRASILTGRNPNRCGVVNHGWPMRPQDTTIAEALKQSGYATGLVGTKTNPHQISLQTLSEMGENQKVEIFGAITPSTSALAAPRAMPTADLRFIDEQREIQVASQSPFGLTLKV